MIATWTIVAVVLAALIWSAWRDDHPCRCSRCQDGENR